MGIVQRIEESKAAAKQAKQDQDQAALIAALEAELAEENAGGEEAADPVLVPEPELGAEELDADVAAEPAEEQQPEAEAQPQPEPQPEPEASTASKPKGKK
jgi:hypothetical protein